MTTLDANLELDDRDIAIFRSRFHAYQDLHGPRVGDFLRYADGVVRRVAYVTPAEWLPDVDCVQGTMDGDGYGFYLGHGYCSYSGGLTSGVKRDTLTYSGEHRTGSAWFFHHDAWGAGRGVDCALDFRVYDCSEPCPY